MRAPEHRRADRVRQGLRWGGGALALVVICVAFAPLPRTAQADELAAAKETLDSIAEMLNLRAKEGQPADFVKQSRPNRATLHFIPTGTPHPIRPLPAKTATQVEALKAKLDAAAAAQLKPRVPPPPLELSHAAAVAAAAKRTAGKAAPPNVDPDKTPPVEAN